MELEDEEVPPPFDSKEYGKEWRKQNSGYQKKYREAHGRELDRQYRERDYLNRQIVAWDGEGFTREGVHYYNLLANSEGKYIRSKKKGLSTRRILSFVAEEGTKYPDAIHVIYGGGYDFNMFLSDMDKETLSELYAKDTVVFEGFQIKWRRGRNIEIRDLTVRNSKSTIIYDVLPFFQRSFVTACDEYLKERFTHRDIIVEQKKNRGTFQEEDFKTVLQYNRYELENLVNLVRELRERLSAVGIRLRRWDGPGAIASELLRRYKIQEAMAESPAPIAEAARHAYAGGRFERIKMGVTDNPAYEYDLNSAYPYGMQFLPNLARGHWEHRTRTKKRRSAEPAKRTEFALYHIRFSTSNIWQLRPEPMPFFRRLPNSMIVYGEAVEGWYWAPEVWEWFKYDDNAPMWSTSLEIIESYIFVEDDPDDRPFSFVPELYAERQKLKAEGNGAHVGIKLGLNSLYGKLAQQIGWRRINGELRKPPFHQLEWAGFVTSLCRSLVLDAVISNLDSVVAFETDGVFTTKRLTNLKIGPGLGNWEEIEFKDLSYIQSGFYFATNPDGTELIKSRGADPDSFTRNGIESAFLRNTSYKARSSRFVTAGQALYQTWEYWRTWRTDPRKIDPFAVSKRMHHPDCRLCAEHGVDRELVGIMDVTFPRGWHDTVCPLVDHMVAETEEDRYPKSYPYPVEWLETQDDEESNAMELVGEQRTLDYEYESLWDENGDY